MKQKNFLIVVFSFLFVLLFAFVILFMIHVKKTDAIVLKKKLSCQFGDVVYVSDFVSDLDGEIIDDYLVDTSSIGKKRVEVQFKNSYGFVEKRGFILMLRMK